MNKTTSSKTTTSKASATKTRNAMQKGHTMDYYNEDLPRKVAKRLLDEQPSRKSGDDEELDLDLSIYRKKNIRANTNIQEDDEDDEYISHPADGAIVTKVVYAIGLFVILVILCVMVIRINSVNAKLKAAEARLAAIDDTAVEYNTLKIDYDGLVEQNKLLSDELEALRTNPSAGTQAPTQTNLSVSNGTSATPAPTATQSPTISATPKPSSNQVTHTVAQGETLSKISSLYYGSSNQYKKIKDANNLTGDDLKVGQKLIIPTN